MPHRTVNGARIYYERHGHGEPLLLISGFAISAAVFEPVLERYASRFDCIVYDSRGAGRTRALRRPTSMPELAADLVPGAGHAYPLERPDASFRLLTDWLERRGAIPPGRPRKGALARAEPLTRAFGLPVGALRTGASLGALMADRLRNRGGNADVAVDR